MRALFNWLRRSAKQPRAELDSDLSARLAKLPLPAISAGSRLSEQRLVVLDLETSGLNMNRDQVLSIGAVAIEHGAIDFAQMFERTLLRVDHKLSPSVLIHGLAPSAIAAGSDPAEALLEFLEFAGSSPLLAFHAPFDQHMLGRALKDSLGYPLSGPMLDIAEMAPMLCGHVNLGGNSRIAGLDAWTEQFGLHAEERHHASADALVSAELVLILLSHARRQGIEDLGELQRRLNQWRRRQQMTSL